MKVLLTGNRGRLGPAIERQLVAGGHEVRGFDLQNGDDILNVDAVTAAGGPCASGASPNACLTPSALARPP